MLHPSTKRLIDKLGEMTRRQKVAWQEADDGRITHDTEGYRVTLVPDPLSVLLTDSQGREIETCSPADYADDLDGEGRPYSRFVEDLYQEAKRHARGAEEAISALLAGLDAVDKTVAADPEDNAGLEDTQSASGEADLPVEDPLDDSSPLAPEDYREMDSQSDITSAVASLADKVNAPPVATVFEEAEPLSEPETELTGYGLPPSEETAAPEQAETPAPLNVPEAGFTPTGYEEAPEMDVSAAEDEGETEFAPVFPEAPDTADTYAPAFSDTAPDAPAYIQSEPFSQAPEMPEPAAEAIDEPAPEAASDTWEVIGFDDARNAPAAPEAPDAAEPAETAIETAEPESEPAEAEPAPAPTTPSSFMNPGGFMAGGFGSGLGAYRSEPGPAEPETPAEPDPVAEEGAEFSGSQAEPVADTPAEPLRSFSLSGITARPAPAATPEPVETDDPAEAVSPPQTVIDGTSDLPGWPGSDPVPPIEETPTPEPYTEPAETLAEPEPEIAPEPDFKAAQPEDPAPAPAEEETVAQEEAPARPVKRFNPWN